MKSQQVTKFRNNIQRCYNTLKQPDISTSNYLQTLLELEKVSQQYIAALAYDDEITYLDFYSILDVLTDNIQCLKEKVKK